MNAQTKIAARVGLAPAANATMEEAFAAWCGLCDYGNSPNGLSEAEFNSLCHEIREIEERILTFPIRCPDDVWRKVVVALDQPVEGDRTSEAVLVQEARLALGLTAFRPPV